MATQTTPTSPAAWRPDITEYLPGDAIPEALILTHADKASLFAELSTVFVTRTTAEWSAALGAAGLRYAPVHDYAQAAADPQVIANGHLVEVETPDGATATVVASPVWFSDTPATSGVAVPELGQHTEEVLLELGYTWPEIDTLRTAGAF